MGASTVKSRGENGMAYQLFLTLLSVTAVCVSIGSCLWMQRQLWRQLDEMEQLRQLVRQGDILPVDSDNGVSEERPWKFDYLDYGSLFPQYSRSDVTDGVTESPESTSDVTDDVTRRRTRSANRRRGRRHGEHNARNGSRSFVADLTRKLQQILSEDHPSAHLIPRDIIIEAPHRMIDLPWNWNTSFAHNQIGSLDQGTSLVFAKSGRYYVYSQVTWNGRESNGGSSPRVPSPHCEYGIILQYIEGGAEKEKILLRSRTTQYRMGQKIRSLPDSDVHAHDSSFTGGVFSLSRGDRLSLRVHGHTSTNCRLWQGPEATFMGVVRISATI